MARCDTACHSASGMLQTIAEKMLNGQLCRRYAAQAPSEGPAVQCKPDAAPRAATVKAVTALLGRRLQLESRSPSLVPGEYCRWDFNG